MGKLINYVGLLKPRFHAAWAIGIYLGDEPLNLRPHPALCGRPAITPDMLGQIDAHGVADPFMIRVEDFWYLFFEIENRRTGKGEIGLAISRDLISWQFGGIVLEEAFHLSYPHVFMEGGAYWMIPESVAAGVVRLYRARHFPTGWELVGELIRDAIVDATPFHHDGRWWIIAQRGFLTSDEMVVFHAEELVGPWHPHAMNPIYSQNRRITRPAGRVIAMSNRLVRFAQDGTSHYGRCVNAFTVDWLTATEYAESPATKSPVLAATGSGWSAKGMHHLDLHQLGQDSWVACVDGRRTVLMLPLYERVLSRLRK